MALSPPPPPSEQSRIPIQPGRKLLQWSRMPQRGFMTELKQKIKKRRVARSDFNNHDAEYEKEDWGERRSV